MENQQPVQYAQIAVQKCLRLGLHKALIQNSRRPDYFFKLVGFFVEVFP